MADDKPNLPPFWIFFPGAVFVAVLIFLGSLRHRPLLVLELGLLAPCLAGVFCRVLHWKASRILAIFAVAVYWMGLGALTILMMTNGIFLLVYYGIFILPTVAIVIFATRSARKGMASVWIHVGAGVGFACGVVAIVIAIAPAIRRASQRASIFPATPISRTASNAKP
ncbi:MAG TPA: hypothetical protein VN745_06205 [Verrucomicrobiae bacterium]|nr:hypothetical protein [Verrucomicrobiae bacterium]